MTEQEKIALKEAFKEYPEQSLIGHKKRLAYQRGWLKGYQTARQNVLQELADESKKLEE
jgi:hypothetical protein